MKTKIFFQEPFSKHKATIIRSLIEYSLNTLLRPLEETTVHIDVIFERGLRKDYQMISSLDAIEEDGSEFEQFELCIDASATIPEILSAVAHECVHIKQFVLKECHDSFHSKSQSALLHDTFYWEDPLEIEAYGRELGLVLRWLRHSGNTDKSWARGIRIH